MPRDEVVAAEFKARGVALPSLHVIGAKDEIIPEERSRELAASCPDARVYVHPGGHFLPTCTGAFKQEVACFFDSVEQRQDDKQVDAVELPAAHQSAL
jgi:fermentation-respiration switch protein FrsA (DUF1100 family)